MSLHAKIVLDWLIKRYCRYSRVKHVKFDNFSIVSEARKTTIEINRFSKLQTEKSVIQIWSEKAFKITVVVNTTLPYLHVGHFLSWKNSYGKHKWCPKKGFLNMVYRFCIIKTGKVFETLLNLGFSEYSQKKTFLSICQNLFKLKTSKSSYKRFLYIFLLKNWCFFILYWSRYPYTV